MSAIRLLSDEVIRGSKKRGATEELYELRAKVQKWRQSLDVGNHQSAIELHRSNGDEVIDEGPMAGADIDTDDEEEVASSQFGTLMTGEGDMSRLEYSYSTDFSHAADSDLDIEGASPGISPPSPQSYDFTYLLLFKQGKKQPAPLTEASLTIQTRKLYDDDYRIAEALLGECKVGTEVVGFVTALLINRNRLREHWAF